MFRTKSNIGVFIFQLSLSAFSAAIAAKTELKAAAQFAGLASGVTVRKIGVTGTASPEEIEALAQ